MQEPETTIDTRKFRPFFPSSSSDRAIVCKEEGQSGNRILKLVSLKFQSFMWKEVPPRLKGGKKYRAVGFFPSPASQTLPTLEANLSHSICWNPSTSNTTLNLDTAFEQTIFPVVLSISLQTETRRPSSIRFSCLRNNIHTDCSVLGYFSTPSSRKAHKQTVLSGPHCASPFSLQLLAAASNESCESRLTGQSTIPDQSHANIYCACQSEKLREDSLSYKYRQQIPPTPATHLQRKKRPPQTSHLPCSACICTTAGARRCTLGILFEYKSVDSISIL